MKTCPDCGERVYNLGCVNCNEAAYIEEQIQLTARYGEAEQKADVKEPVRQCPSCGGAGMVPVCERFVTRDMASDAGDLSMEGLSLGPEFGPCDECGGGGLIDGEAESH